MPFTYCCKTANTINMSQDPFKKFKNPKKNSTVKEELRQEKKKYKKERAAYFDKLKEEKYQKKRALSLQPNPLASLHLK